MGEIINLNEVENDEAKVKLEQFNEVKELLNTLSNEDEDFMKILGAVIETDDETLKVIKPGLLDSLSRSINNPTDKLALVASLNANGLKAEDLMDSYQVLADEIRGLDILSDVKKDFCIEMIGILTNAVNDTEGIAKRYVNVPFELCHKDAKVPQYANVTDSGMDVFALDDYTINPGETKLIPTGIKMAIPNGYEIQVRPKSGRALKTKLRVANTPGTIDAGYRDEIKVIMENIESPIKDIGYEFDENGNVKITSIVHGSPYYIAKGEKFAQLVLIEVPKAALVQVGEVSSIGEDRGGGFGSTGLK